MFHRPLLLIVALCLFGSMAWASARPRYGGTLTVPLSAPPVVADPISLDGQEELLISSTLFDTLYATSPDGSLTPNLTQSEPVSSEDKRTFTLKLLPGLTFHNGTPMRAQEVADSLTRLLSPKASAHAWLLADLDGAKEYWTGKAKQVSGIKVVSQDELSLTFVRALSQQELMLRLSSQPTAIVKVSGQTLVGSGPFARDPKGKGKAELRLVPFVEHARGRPFLERLIFRQYSTLDAQVAFSKRDLLLLFNSPLSKDSAARLLEGPQLISELFIPHKLDGSYIGSEAFRRALRVALDRDVALKFALRDLLDQGQSAAKVLPEGLSPRGNARAPSYDPTSARDALREAASKAKLPAELEIIYDESQSGHRRLAEQLREYLAEIDAPKAREVALDPGSFDARRKKGDFAVALLRFSPVAPMQLGLPNLVAATGDLAGAFDLVAKGVHLSDSAAKKREDALASQVVLVGHRSPKLLFDPRVKSLSFNAVGLLDLSRVWIEP